MGVFRQWQPIVLPHHPPPLLERQLDISIDRRGSAQGELEQGQLRLCLFFRVDMLVA